MKAVFEEEPNFLRSCLFAMETAGSRDLGSLTSGSGTLGGASSGVPVLDDGLDQPLQFFEAFLADTGLAGHPRNGRVRSGDLDPSRLPDLTIGPFIERAKNLLRLSTFRDSGSWNLRWTAEASNR